MDPIGKRPADINPDWRDFGKALIDPEYWAEFTRCMNDPAFWKTVWEEMKTHRVSMSLGGNVGANTKLLDFSVGVSFGVILGKDRTQDRYWNSFVNGGGGFHLGPKEKKFVGAGGGLNYSRDGLQTSIGFGAGRLGWGDDPLNGQSASYSKMNSRGISIGDMAAGASKNYGLATPQKYIDQLLAAASSDMGVKVTLAPGANLQGPLITRGPMGLTFSWVIYPLMDKLVYPAIESAQAARSRWLDKTIGPVDCKQVEKTTPKDTWVPYACREKAAGEE
ncbi:MAG: hypothetical protein K1X64_01815 [Myxococcaceae bacterium]|nr:hypothetical protein [Myxococcaceae bacterium]